MDHDVKRRRFSVEPDITVLVEGDVFRLHSQPLMMKSSVFRRMLESQMSEAADRNIRLDGKLEYEFVQVLPFFSGETDVYWTERVSPRLNGRELVPCAQKPQGRRFL